MGQYHSIINLDKEEAVNPNMFGDGIKLTEIAYSHYSTTSALAFLLADEWKNSTVLVAGDYTKEKDLRKDTLKKLRSIDKVLDIYTLAKEISKDYEGYGFKNYKDIKEKLRKSFDVTFKQAEWTDIKGYNQLEFDKLDYEEIQSEPLTKSDWEDDYQECLIYNYDKDEYISFGENSLLDIAGGKTGIMSGYLYLIALSNGEGGGDLSENPEFESGSWAGDKTGIVSKQLEPELFNKITQSQPLDEKVDGFREYFDTFSSDHFNKRNDLNKINESITIKEDVPRLKI